MSGTRSKPEIVVWGASGHASVVADIIRLSGIYEIAGFLDDLHPDRWGDVFCGARILGGQEQLDPLLARGVTDMLFGFGDCAARLRLADLASAKGFQYPTAVHPRATVAQDVLIGPGTVVAAGAVVNPGVRIGQHVIVNTSASLDHDCIIEDGVHICPGARLAGGVRVERSAWVGIGATLIEHLRIGQGAKIGAGAVVLRDVQPGRLVYGVPARVVGCL